MKERTIVVKVKLTKSGFKELEAAAFKNCRTVSQELTYRIEKDLARKEPVAAVPYDYDKRAVEAAQWHEAEPNEDVGVIEPPRPASNEAWTPEQEDQVYAAGKDLGLSEAQVTAARLINKTPEATIEAMKSEAGEKVS